ncbi:MAG: aldehyde dehydrogenase family protein [Gammaproteobacteria bacterium]
MAEAKVIGNYIGGEWRAPEGGAVSNTNPSNPSDIIGVYTQADEAQLQLALSAAVEGFGKWRAAGLEKRQAVLTAIGNEMMARAAELGEMIAREEGKPRAEGVGEAYRAGQFFNYFAAEVLRPAGESVDSVREGVEIEVRREPLGVVAVISPWNFPLAAASWKIAPALAFGNAVIWKPATLTPASAVLLAEIIAKQDIPSGVFNLLMGGGGTIGSKLAAAKEVDAISFTGSFAAGREVAIAAAGQMTRLQAEMGSKNPLVVMDDADIETAVQCAAGGAFGGTGQKCTASSRIIVHDKIYKTFAEKLAEKTKTLRVGDALAEGTEIGPVASAAQLKSNIAYLTLARDEGAVVLTGGEVLQESGYYMRPALLEGDNTMRINREEMFAPIACLIRARDYEEALAIANDSDYGLVAGIITSSLARSADFRRRAVAGCVMINLPTAGTDYHVPFGGRKRSSCGPREQGRAAAEFYTAVKTNYVRGGSPG